MGKWGAMGRVSSLSRVQVIIPYLLFEVHIVDDLVVTFRHNLGFDLLWSKVRIHHNRQMALSNTRCSPGLVRVENPSTK